jgi:hypothetical protein
VDNTPGTTHEASDPAVTGEDRFHGTIGASEGD